MVLFCSVKTLLNTKLKMEAIPLSSLICVLSLYNYELILCFFFVFFFALYVAEEH